MEQLVAFGAADDIDLAAEESFPEIGVLGRIDGVPQLGLEALDQAIKVDPIGMADCHLIKGNLFELNGAKQLAAAEYKQFLTKVPDYKEKKRLEKFIAANPN
jgi:hypothetical protein